jgi:hypothetical protein
LQACTLNSEYLHRAKIADDQHDDAGLEQLSHTSHEVSVVIEPPAQTQPIDYEASIGALLARYAEDDAGTKQQLNVKLEGQELTPLLWSVQHGEVQLARELLNTGCIDMNMRTRDGVNALFMSILAAEAERADTTGMAKSSDHDLKNRLKYPLEEMLLLVQAAGASWATIFDDDKLFSESLTSLPHYPDVIRCIYNKHAEAAAAAARETLQEEHAQVVQGKDRQLAAMREARRLLRMPMAIMGTVVAAVLITILITLTAVLYGYDV